MSKVKLVIAIIYSTMLLSVHAQQKTYLTSGGDVILSWGQMALNQDWVTANSSGGNTPLLIKTPTRFTAFLHIGQFVNLDISNNIGFYSGFSLRNIGMISDETLPSSVGSDEFVDIKVVRRTYTAGVPIGFKLGSFKDHFFLYGGGEIEWAFHYKEKYWLSHSRDKTKTKYSEWWPNQVTKLQPSAFVGLQFPGGINLKYKYYLNNFLNHDYKGNSSNTTSVVVSDLTKYEESTLMYLSLSWHFNTAKVTQAKPSEDEIEEVAWMH